MERPRIHPETGEKLRRGVRSFTVHYAGRARTVDLPGWYPVKKNGEGVHVGDDMTAAERALAELKALEATEAEKNWNTVLDGIKKLVES